jgi:ATP-dependent DNA helicase RecG
MSLFRELKLNREPILKKPIQYIKGVGQTRAKLLEKLGIFTVEDMLYHFPRDYEDRSNIKKIEELYDLEPAVFKAEVISGLSNRRIRKGLSIQKLIVGDNTGTISLTWFNQEYLKDSFVLGQEYVFFGKPAVKVRNYLEMQNPIFERFDHNLKETGKIVPIYNATASLSQKVIRSIIRNCLDLLENQLQEFIPNQIRQKHSLAEINYAMQHIHFPLDKVNFEFARKRLVFEELLLLQLGLLSIKTQTEAQAQGIEFKSTPQVNAFIEKLPFKLTNAQKRVLTEIEKDMESPKIMNRLIQGDVGSGKTIVAALAMLKVVNNGYQAAMMVPTGILAEQHYSTFADLFTNMGLKISLITGSLTAKQKREVLEEITSGHADIVIGTHALIEENIIFKQLGLIITDEQHRFGVRQRAKLITKGDSPAVIVMTATPIPRTLALILYGDLDISVIDELPPGRKSIQTYQVSEDVRERINAFIKKQLDRKKQAYVVCPLVEDSELMTAKSVQNHADQLKKQFVGYQVAYVHGKMKSKEKEEIMRNFYNGQIDILVSTTVIEVGVNVPNATLMIVENAEKFGLAQLHQLRGRVGRGDEQSYCILMCQSKSKVAQERMKIMQKSSDGFLIAEKDLELRGVGEFFGTRQHGIPDLKIANLFKDIDVLKEAQEEAKDLLKADSRLKKKENTAIKQKVLERFVQRAEEISWN